MNQETRKFKGTVSRQHLVKRDPDTGERWTIRWDTKRKPETAGRSTALAKSESEALDRARHLLRMGFIVYEISQPSGSAFLDEAEIVQRLGLRAATPALDTADTAKI